MARNNNNYHAQEQELARQEQNTFATGTGGARTNTTTAADAPQVPELTREMKDSIKAVVIFRTLSGAEIAGIDNASEPADAINDLIFKN